MSVYSNHFEAMNVSCIRADKYLFRNLSFKLGPAECLNIQGPNGSGKSTLLKVLAGLIAPDKGKISWATEAITTSGLFKEQMAYVSHKLGINLALTVKENIEHQLALAQCKLKQSALSAVMEKLGLTSKEKSPCYQLSQGQQRKVALASLVLKNKPLWLLDEPFTSLDVASIAMVTDFLEEHLLAQGVVIMASHHPVALSGMQVLSL